jgi:hypothetical protein
MGISSNLEQGHEGHIREVLQEDGFSSMYSKYLLYAHSHVMSCVPVICSHFFMLMETDS